MASVRNRGTKDKPEWYGSFKDLDGKWKLRHTHQPTKKMAQELADEWEARVSRGLPAIVEPSSDEGQHRVMTVRQLCEKFVAEYSRPRIRSLKRYRQQARTNFNQRLYPYPISKLPATGVRLLHVEAWRDALREDGYANESTNQVIIRLQTAYNWAIDREILSCKNPIKGVELMPTSPSTDHFAIEEVHLLLDPDRAPRPMIAVALYTGMRKGELFGLTKPCIFLDATPPYIEVRRSYDGTPKGGKPRKIPVHRELVPILREWLRECPKALHPGPADPAHAWTGGKGEELVFPVSSPDGWRPGRSGDMEELQDVLQGAGCHIPALRPWHTLRHTFATHFAEAGGAMHALEKILGHSGSGFGRSNPITAGYAHFGLDFLAREIARLSFSARPPAGVISFAEERRRRMQERGELPEAQTAPPPRRVKPAAIRGSSDLMTSDEAAQRFGYKTAATFKSFRVRHHDLNAMAQTIDRRLYWRRADVERWIEQNPQYGPGAARAARAARA